MYENLKGFVRVEIIKDVPVKFGDRTMVLPAGYVVLCKEAALVKMPKSRSRKIKY